MKNGGKAGSQLSHFFSSAKLCLLLEGITIKHTLRFQLDFKTTRRLRRLQSVHADLQPNGTNCHVRNQIIQAVIFGDAITSCHIAMTR